MSGRNRRDLVGVDDAAFKGAHHLIKADFAREKELIVQIEIIMEIETVHKSFESWIVDRQDELHVAIERIFFLSFPNEAWQHRRLLIMNMNDIRLKG